LSFIEAYAPVSPRPAGQDLQFPLAAWSSLPRLPPRRACPAGLRAMMACACA
jgi:hypothetical protein